MLVLGVANANDSGAVLIADGVLIAAANEERFVRKKLIRAFPKKSIEYVLSSQGVSIDEVDWVGAGCWHGIDQVETLPRLVEDIFDQLRDGQEGTRIQVYNRIQVSAERDSYFKKELYSELSSLGIPCERIICYDHHLSHAYTAFYPSPFEEAFVLTADGRGDYRSVTLWKASRNDGLIYIAGATDLASPGALYGFITKLLGFTPDRHEGKITGLAAFGCMSGAYELLKKGFFFDPDCGRIRSRIGSYYQPFISAEMEQLRKELSPYSREEIAFAVQKLLEDTLLAFLEHHLSRLEEYDIDLCLAGGTMGNVKLNYELTKLRQVRNIYVFPQMGDGGNALGGAIGVACEKNGMKSIDLPTVYLGPQYEEEDIIAILKREGIEGHKLAKTEKGKIVASLIAEGKVVGWFQGRMEYGPRALGARSILASATDPAINEILNKRLHRTEFMPFAPVTLDVYASRCFIGWEMNHMASRFMATCYDCTPFLAERCPAVVHVDQTARPQVVFRKDNPDYYDCIEAYIDMTGNPAIINTSFNHHEEPIVNTPEDAIRSFQKDNVDVMVLEDLLVMKP